VVKVVEEVVGEELLGSAELAAGSAGWGNNQSGLPPVTRTQRKMTAGTSRGPASLASAAGKFLVMEGRGDELLLLAQSDTLGRLIDDGQWCAKQRLVQSRAARSVAERGWGKSGVGDDFLGDVRSSAKKGPTHVGSDDRLSPVPRTLHTVSTATGNSGGARDRATVPGGQTETGR
jgi:hypothetical protein